MQPKQITCLQATNKHWKKYNLKKKDLNSVKFIISL